jgi:hypothetical protein
MFSEQIDTLEALIWARRVEAGWDEIEAAETEATQEEQDWACDEFIQRQVRHAEFMHDLLEDR